MLRNYFFNHPKRTAAVTWGISTLPLLLETILTLDPLGRRRSDAKKERDSAQSDYDHARSLFDTTTAKLAEAEQRIGDLTCAMAGYQQFNNQISAFQNNILTATGSSLETLSTFWQLQYSPDKCSTYDDIVPKKYIETNFVYEKYYSCDWHTCPKHQSCCEDWGSHAVDTTYYYNEITKINSNYENIVIGPPLTLPQLQCGYYSRGFGTTSPEVYQTGESEHRKRGDMRAGSIYIDFTREYGSRVRSYFLLEEQSITQMNTVKRDADRIHSADDLLYKLNQFLAMAVAACRLAGANYPALQSAIQNQLPSLVNDAARANATMYDQSLVLADKLEIYSDVNAAFNKGLIEWLPVLVLVPAGIALAVYLLLLHCKNKVEVYDDKHVFKPSQRSIVRIESDCDSDSYCEEKNAVYAPLLGGEGVEHCHHNCPVTVASVLPVSVNASAEGQSSAYRGNSYSPTHFRSSSSLSPASPPQALGETSEGAPPPSYDSVVGLGM